MVDGIGMGDLCDSPYCTLDWDHDRNKSPTNGLSQMPSSGDRRPGHLQPGSVPNWDKHKSKSPPPKGIILHVANVGCSVALNGAEKANVAKHCAYRNYCGGRFGWIIADEANDGTQT